MFLAGKGGGQYNFCSVSNFGFNMDFSPHSWKSDKHEVDAFYLLALKEEEGSIISDSEWHMKNLNFSAFNLKFSPHSSQKGGGQYNFCWASNDICNLLLWQPILIPEPNQTNWTLIFEHCTNIGAPTLFEHRYLKIKQIEFWHLQLPLMATHSQNWLQSNKLNIDIWTPIFEYWY